MNNYNLKLKIQHRLYQQQNVREEILRYKYNKIRTRSI